MANLFLGLQLVYYISILHLPNAAAYGAKLAPYPREHLQHKHLSINVSRQSYLNALSVQKNNNKRLTHWSVYDLVLICFMTLQKSTIYTLQVSKCQNDFVFPSNLPSCRAHVVLATPMRWWSTPRSLATGLWISTPRGITGCQRTAAVRSECWPRWRWMTRNSQARLSHLEATWTFG